MIDIQTNKEEDILLISVNGEVDATSSIELDNVIKDSIASESKIMVDLSEMKYISSAGLGVFVSHLEDVKDTGVQWVLFGMTEAVFQVFDLLGLPELLTIVNTKEEALGELK